MIKYNIYIIYILMQTGSKLGCYIPLPLQQHCPQCFTTLKKNALVVLPLAISRIEQKWMCQSHGILQLPRSLFRITVLPLHLYLSNGMIWNSSKSLLACINTNHDIFSSLGESFSSTWNIFGVFGNQQYLCSSPKK